MADFETGTLTATATAPTGTANSASQLILDTVGAGGATFTVPTAAGTVSFWGSGDGGVTWMPLAVTPSAGGTPVTTSSAAGLWAANTSAYTHLAMVATAITGGSISVALHTSTVAGRTSGGGGGPGGMVPPGSTGIVSLTTTGTSGVSTYSSSTGILNIPNYISSGGMVPAGSTGIVAPITTTGSSGASTYNSTTGALNIPVYASGTINSISAAIPSNLTTTSTTVVSSGFGIGPFTAASNPLALVCFNLVISHTASNVLIYLPIYRTTGAIPASGAAIGGGDVEMNRPRGWVFTAGTSNTMNGAFLDNSLLVGTAYRYYLGFYTTSGTATVYTTIPGPSLQIVELK